MRKLSISPDADSYQVAYGADSFGVDYGGGASRVRPFFRGVPADTSARWTLSPMGYAYFMAFFRTSIAQGSLPFLLDLIVEQGGTAECKVKIIPGSLAMSGKRGSSFAIEARLSVSAPPPPRDDDLALLESFVPRY